MDRERHAIRTEVDIPVTVTTVLESIEAAITDLNEFGARIDGLSVPAGSRVQIDYMGQTIFAQCRWAEIDRIGVKFLFRLADGPLFERLQIAEATQPDARAQDDADIVFVPLTTGKASLGARTFVRVPVAGAFGRRN